MIRIAIDAMGGDRGPRTVVQGALAAARDLPLELTLVGPEGELRGELARAGSRTGAVRVCHAGTVVGMAESPTEALRRKPDASVRVSAALLAAGEVDALVGVGHTGAMVMAVHGALGMIPGVDRPALATGVPTSAGVGVLLDVGANVGCRPGHLVQFAVMGSVFAHVALGIERPRVGLLSIGEEETKGNDLIRDAHRLLKDSPLNFGGNIDARALYHGTADVIVCDGFTGNVALKVSEGLAELIAGLMAAELSGPAAPDLSLPIRRSIRRLRKRLDYAEYGGAPLLGVAGLAVVGHGRSSARAVRNAIALAHRFAETGLVGRIQDEIAAVGAWQS